MTYTPEDFPVGTIVELKNGSTYPVTRTSPPHRNDNDFNVHLNGHGSIQPTWRGSMFKRIVSTPRVQDAKPEDSQIRAGDRVRATPLFPGMSGSTEGIVKKLTPWEYDILFEGQVRTIVVSRNSDVFGIEKVAPTWQEKLDALPLRAVVEGKGLREGNFAIKTGQSEWVAKPQGGRPLVLTALDESAWMIPDGSDL